MALLYLLYGFGISTVWRRDIDCIVWECLLYGIGITTVWYEYI
jgi:hypothetical protein